MADRLLALVGKGRGPVLRTAGMREPRLRVHGLLEGERLTVETDSETLIIDKSGVHEIEVTGWVQIASEGECKDLICTVHEKE